MNTVILFDYSFGTVEKLLMRVDLTLSVGPSARLPVPVNVWR